MIASELDSERPFIFELPNIFTSDECNQWISRIQAAGTEVATINTRSGTQVDSQIRNNRRVIFDDPNWANILYERVKEKVPHEIHGMTLSGINERLRCYEYQPGQRFAPHSDGAFVRDEKERSWYTYMIYLNEGFAGGETIFLVEPEIVITPKAGAALLFQHPIIHEGSEVISGVKYVVRTDLMYRDSSK